jgi:hypothetical protein
MCNVHPGQISVLSLATLYIRPHSPYSSLPFYYQKSLFIFFILTNFSLESGHCKSTLHNPYSSLPLIIKSSSSSSSSWQISALSLAIYYIHSPQSLFILAFNCQKSLFIFFILTNFSLEPGHSVHPLSTTPIHPCL